jgi:integrase
MLKLLRRKDSPNWWIRGSIRGISVCESTKVAYRESAEIILTIRSKEVLDESLFGKRINVTFDETVRSYLDADGSPRFLRVLCEEIGPIHLRKLRQNDLDNAARKLYPTAQRATRNRQCYTPFIAVWNHAVRNGWAEARQWSRPRKAKGTNSRRLVVRSGSAPVDYERARQFVSHMSPAPAMVMTALFFTGMRPIELFALRAADVNIKGRWIVISSSKTGEPRGVPMHEFLVPLFEGLMERGGILFRTHKGEPYPILEDAGGQLKGAIRGARKRSGIDDISPYTARHTVSTQLVINGIHPHLKDQILGHVVDDMSRRYTHVPQAPLTEAINTIVPPDGWPMWDHPVSDARRFVKWGRNAND